MDGVAGDVLLVAEDDGGVAAPATWMLFTSPLTPLTAPAIWAARARFSLESTVPLSVTMPVSVLTSILRKFEGDSAASLVVTSAEIRVSSMNSPTVRAWAETTPPIASASSAASAREAMRAHTPDMAPACCNALANDRRVASHEPIHWP